MVIAEEKYKNKDFKSWYVCKKKLYFLQEDVIIWYDWHIYIQLIENIMILVKDFHKYF